MNVLVLFESMSWKKEKVGNDSDCNIVLKEIFLVLVLSV